METSVDETHPAADITTDATSEPFLQHDGIALEPNESMFQRVFHHRDIAFWTIVRAGWIVCMRYSLIHFSHMHFPDKDKNNRLLAMIVFVMVPIIVWVVLFGKLFDCLRCYSSFHRMILHEHGQFKVYRPPQVADYINDMCVGIPQINRTAKCFDVQHLGLDGPVRATHVHSVTQTFTYEPAEQYEDVTVLPALPRGNSNIVIVEGTVTLEMQRTDHMENGRFRFESQHQCCSTHRTFTAEDSIKGFVPCKLCVADPDNVSVFVEYVQFMYSLLLLANLQFLLDLFFVFNSRRVKIVFKKRTSPTG